MDSLSSGRVAQTLQRLLAEAEIADKGLMDQFEGGMAALSEQAHADIIADMVAEERRDLRGVYRGYANNFLNVAPAYGRFLYQCARARRATRIVEFGTSMGISTIYLAAALRDMGGGQLIGAAGLADLVDIRVGDARETLAHVDGEIDLVLLDGAFSLYLPVLKLLEPHLRGGTPILAENAWEQGNDYLDYVRDPANGYLSQPLPVTEGRGNEFTIVTR